MAEIIPPSDREIYKKLRTWNQGIENDLRESLSKPFVNLAERIITFVDEKSSKVDQIANWHPIDMVPYAVADLPPNLFEPFGNNTLITPRSEDELQSFMAEYVPYNVKYQSQTHGFVAGRKEDHLALEGTLRLRMKRGETVLDHTAWEQYQETYLAQRERDFNTLSFNSATISRPGFLGFNIERKTFDHFTGRFDSFLIASNSTTDMATQPVRTPIGAYGRKFADIQTRTALFMMDFIQQDPELLHEARLLNDRQRELVQNHTARAKEAWGIPESIILTGQEGVLQVHAQFSSATATELDGYPTEGSNPLPRLAKDDIPNKAALLASLGTSAPIIVHGIFLPNMLHEQNGQFAISPDSQKHLEEMRTSGRRDLHYPQWEAYQEKVATGTAKAEDLPIRTGTRCPFAGDYKNEQGILSPGAITKFTEAYATVAAAIEPKINKRFTRYRPWNLPSFLS